MVLCSIIYKTKTDENGAKQNKTKKSAKKEELNELRFVLLNKEKTKFRSFFVFFCKGHMGNWKKDYDVSCHHGGRLYIAASHPCHKK